jgi:hypothetical protein
MTYELKNLSEDEKKDLEQVLRRLRQIKNDSGYGNLRVVVRDKEVRTIEISMQNVFGSSQ